MIVTKETVEHTFANTTNRGAYAYTYTLVHLSPTHTRTHTHTQTHTDTHRHTHAEMHIQYLNAHIYTLIYTLTRTYKCRRVCTPRHACVHLSTLACTH